MKKRWTKNLSNQRVASRWVISFCPFPYSDNRGRLYLNILTGNETFFPPFSLSLFLLIFWTRAVVHKFYLIFSLLCFIIFFFLSYRVLIFTGFRPAFRLYPIFLADSSRDLDFRSDPNRQIGFMLMRSSLNGVGKNEMHCKIYTTKSRIGSAWTCRGGRRMQLHTIEGGGERGNARGCAHQQDGIILWMSFLNAFFACPNAGRAGLYVFFFFPLPFQLFGHRSIGYWYGEETSLNGFNTRRLGARVASDMGRPGVLRYNGRNEEKKTDRDATGVSRKPYLDTFSHI